MALIVSILKNLWPRVLVNTRQPLDRSNFRTLPDGTYRTIQSGEVRTVE